MAEQVMRNSGGSAVYGNLAYDFANPKFYGKFTLDEPMAAPAPPEVEEQAVPRTRAVAAPRPAFAPFAVIGYALAGVLLIFMLTSYIQLTAISDETVAIEAELKELKLQKDKLLISYESSFNLAEIEEYAIFELGMQKPRSDQVFYVDKFSPDMAVVLSGETETDGFWERFSDLTSSLGEYFKKS